MATLLTNPRMDPALAARIEASVTGKKLAPGAPRSKPRFVMLMRLGVVVLVAFVVQSVVGWKRKERADVTRVRTELLAAIRPHATLSQTERDLPKRVEGMLVTISRSFERDRVAPELSSQAGFDAALARPMLYVRGPLGSFASGAQIADSAATSGKDSLVLCLFDPPSSRAEKDVLPKVRVAYGTGTALEAQTANVRRLGEARAGLPFLSPDYVAKAEASTDIVELTKMKKEVDRAPLDAARRAAKSQLLLAVMDEPGEGGGPAELDGERRHHVRVVLVDLTNGAALLDVRRLADPAWISEKHRADMARGLDSCVVAMDVRDAAFGSRR
ncbi:MAG: hypothetical protein JST00_29185 [Deltaproteobacteria bacterium]|nr:hypothetical protein [Deltaproteobacteria bacterium]